MFLEYCCPLGSVYLAIKLMVSLQLYELLCIQDIRYCVPGQTSKKIVNQIPQGLYLTALQCTIIFISNFPPSLGVNMVFMNTLSSRQLQ